MATKLGSIKISDADGKYPAGARLDLVWFVSPRIGGRREYAIYAQNKALGIDEAPGDQITGARLDKREALRTVIAWYGEVGSWVKVWDLRLTRSALRSALNWGLFDR